VKRFFILLRANFLMYARNTRAMIFSLAIPIGLTLLMGSIWGKQTLGGRGDDQAAGVPFVNYLIPNMIVMSLLANGVMGNSIAMATWRERGILRRIQTTPLPIWQMLLARTLVQAVVMVAQAFLLIATGVLVFHATFGASELAMAVPGIVLGAVLFMAMGVAVAATVSKTETVQVAAQALYFPLMFLGGLAIPMFNFPEWLRGIGKYLPSAMVVDLVRAPLLGTTAMNELPLAVSAAGAGLCFVAAVGVGARFFRWT
jgi:ABC-2 type transport system permease protein